MKKVFAFDRVNFILLAIGMAIVIIGLILMSGSGSTEEQFNPAIFDTRRITVAPIVCLFGYLFMVYAIVRRPHDKKEETASITEGSNTEETITEEKTIKD